eukprot:Sspe_Gene.88208::Locus_60269_Transcript_1_1_Confidence_1.000_Length_2169::g.88208::m.88208/K01835/pgm; phosphoglucomutase
MAISKHEEQQYMDYLQEKGVSKLVNDMLEEVCTKNVPHPQSHLATFLSSYKRSPYPDGSASTFTESEGGVQEVAIAAVKGDGEQPGWNAERGNYTIAAMGTSGLRLKQADYNRPGFLEQFAQGVARYFAVDVKEKLESAGHPNPTTVLVGGDPRRGNAKRIETITRCLVANGLKVLVASNGIASTPAMSHAIRHLKAAGAIILTASHNPATDAGIKINSDDGAPALEDTVKQVHTYQNEATSWKAIGDIYAARYEGVVRDVDCVRLYADLLDSIFDFRAMQQLIQMEKNFKIALDCMHGAAGPFAREVFINRLGFVEGSSITMVRETPRADLGGDDAHPEPDFDYIKQLIDLNATNEYNLVAAWDSDVDRRLDGGKGFFVESADEFCLFAKYGSMINLTSLPQFATEINYCRSTVTSHAIDLLKEDLQKQAGEVKVNTIETATGFKYIAEKGNWGVEESNGVGNPFLREKDGIFATVFLLKIILAQKSSVRDLMEDVWGKYGRVYFTRGEVSGSDAAEKEQLIKILNDAVAEREDEARREGAVQEDYAGLKVQEAKRWVYRGERPADKDPDAWVLKLSDSNVVKARFSGTGSGGYCLRVYCSKYSKDFKQTKAGITQPMKDSFNAFLKAKGWTGPEACKFTDACQPDPYN